MMERITSKKYRFSILRFVHVIDTLFKSIKILNYPRVELLLNRAAPFFMGEAMVAVTNPNKALFPLLGVMVAELILYLRLRFTGLVND
jgi:hypothetical protein